jgi:hypothetical protein
VPSIRDPQYIKANNLCQIFEGEFPVFFYDAERAKYATEPIGVAMSPYVLQELERLLGKENVILK